MVSRGGTAETLINDIQHLDWVVDGVSFMKATIAHLEQQRKETAIQGGRFCQRSRQTHLRQVQVGRGGSAH